MRNLLASFFKPESIRAALAELVDTFQSDEQWRRIGIQISGFLTQLADYISSFFNEYRQPIISIALIVAACKPALRNYRNLHNKRNLLRLLYDCCHLN